MAGESPSVRQDDIEDLLRQAQLAAGVATEPDAASVPGGEPGSAPVAASQPPTASPAAAMASSAGVAVASAPAGAPAPRTSSSEVSDDIQFLLAQAEQAIASVNQPAEPGIPGLAPFELKDLSGAPASGEKASLQLLSDVDLDVRIELGRTEMYLEDVLQLKRGSVVALDKLAGDPVDIFVNSRMVARGEVLVLNDNFCVRVTELVAGDDFE
jgi:flagellar motor switch protein FliN/FliY